MLIFFRNFTDPYLNIAAEEYYVKHANEDMCMLWINEKSVILGKHQNAYAEINYPYIRANMIPVIRRISGGGAVYHDNGNVNFTFIQKTDKNNQVDFGRFTSVIIRFLQTFGIQATISKRNSLFINNLKFSGHAEHVFHDRVLHHGTLLFNTDLEALKHCLSPTRNYPGKAMLSVRSDVMNISPLLPGIHDIHQLIQNMIEWLLSYFPGSSKYYTNEEDVDAISRLAETKYRTWQWNFGYSPSYSFQVDMKTIRINISMTIRVENGKIASIKLPSELLSQSIAAILSGMVGISHNEEDIFNFVLKNSHSLELAGINIVNFTKAFFQ